MLHLQETIHLEDDEDIISIRRTQKLGTIAFLFLISAGLFVLFLFTFPLFRQGLVGVSIFLFIMLVLLGFGARKIVAWFGTMCILTSRRMIMVRRYGLIRKKVKEIKLKNILDLSYEKKGIRQAVGRYGTLFMTLKTSPDKGIQIEGILHPDEVLDQISKAMSALGAKMPKTGADRREESPLAKKRFTEQKPEDIDDFLNEEEN